MNSTTSSPTAAFSSHGASPAAERQAPGPAVPSVISAHGLVKQYGTTMALHGVDLELLAGESLAIMGASGSGKTTLLHCLAGIITPTSGQVWLHRPQGWIEICAMGESARTKLRREAFGFVFQEGLLIPELTARENVALALMINGTPRAQAEQAATGWLAALGLAGLEDRRIGQLSGGQAQRVAIARAQVTGSSVIFADEPTGALDSATSAEVMDVLLGTAAHTGSALVVVTHNQEIADRCSRTIVLRDGQVVDETRRVAGETRRS